MQPTDMKRLLEPNRTVGGMTHGIFDLSIRSKFGTSVLDPNLLSRLRCPWRQ
jgi:hypothetical protein